MPLIRAVITFHVLLNIKTNGNEQKNYNHRVNVLSAEWDTSLHQTDYPSEISFQSCFLYICNRIRHQLFTNIVVHWGNLVIELYHEDGHIYHKWRIRRQMRGNISQECGPYVVADRTTTVKFSHVWSYICHTSLDYGNFNLRPLTEINLKWRGGKSSLLGDEYLLLLAT